MTDLDLPSVCMCALFLLPAQYSVYDADIVRISLYEESRVALPEQGVRIEKVNYKGWPNCFRLSNSIVDLIVTTDVGPRIIYFGFTGEGNEFKEFETMVGKKGSGDWRIYGGHRLWHAPEEKTRTYYPDNVPVKFEQHRGFVRVIQLIEATTGIQKELDIYLSTDKPQVKVIHRLRNTNLWPVELAPWALTSMAPGGTAIIPLPPRGTHPENLLPTNTLIVWAFTDMSDPRWIWGRKYIMLREDSTMRHPQKIGAMTPDGWTAYVRNGHLFVKKFTFISNARYPDMGCTVEVFTNGDMLELETLGPLVIVESGSITEYTENWFLFKNIPQPKIDADIDQHILPNVQNAVPW